MLLIIVFVYVVKWLRKEETAIRFRKMRARGRTIVSVQLVSLLNTARTGFRHRNWLVYGPDGTMFRRVHRRDGVDVLPVVEARICPFSGPPLHVHEERDEIFEVVEGRFRFQCAGETFDVGAGTTVLVPRGVTHAWVNLGAQPARMLLSFVPGGVEVLLDAARQSPSEARSALASMPDTAIVGPPLVVEGAAEPWYMPERDYIGFLMPLP